METWVSDKLISLFGYSERNTVAYLVALAHSAQSQTDLFTQLQSLDLPTTPQLESFATELYYKVKPLPPAPPVLSSYQQHEEQLIASRKANESYTVLPEIPPEKPAKRDRKNKHLHLSEAERSKAVADLKKQSRWKYLEMREKQQLELAELQLAEEDKMFQGVQLTQKEQTENEMNRRIYELAAKHAQRKSEVTVYRLPDSFEDSEGNIDPNKKVKVLLDRYKDTVAEAPPERAWESSQSARAMAHYGAQDLPPEPEYPLVLEAGVDFELADVQAGSGATEVAAVDPAAEMAKIRASLPVFKLREELLVTIRDNQVVIVVGDTGSGKTTQIPQYLHEVGYTRQGKVACTQPRRVAAMSVASRVAQEMGVKLGHEIGYCIRFEDCTSPQTVVKYMTDGMLLREFQLEPDLKSYSVIMIDEAHERTLHTDILFGLVKDLAKARKDLKLIISSATMDAQKFSEFFQNAPIFNIPGRRFPVDIYYTKAPEADYLEAAVITILQIHVTQGKGDILVFLTGQEDVETAMEMIQTRTRGLGSKIAELIVLPIYSTLPSDLQIRIFEPTPPQARKVVLATNIAETSLTIDGIVYVVDAGLCKQTSYSAKAGLESLIVVPISRASARQRAGRAGRLCPGKCFRLYTLWSYEHELQENTEPEILRTNLGSVVLQLKSLGIDDLVNFDFVDPPPSDTLARALEMLFFLGALDDEGGLTRLGRQMAEFPIDPMMAKSLVVAGESGCLSEVLSLCAMLSVGNTVFFRPKDKAMHADNAKATFTSPEGDLHTLIRVYVQWVDTGYDQQWCFDHYVQYRALQRARAVREQLEVLCKLRDMEENDDPVTDERLISKAFLAGYFFNTAKLHPTGLYKTTKNSHTVHIHPSSALFKAAPMWVGYHELVLTTKEFMRQVTIIEASWLREVAPHYFPATVDAGSCKLPRGVGKADTD